MIEQQGRVLSRKGQQIKVHVGPVTGCAKCDAGQGCGAGLFSRLLKRKPIELELISTEDVRVGQLVMVGLPESHLMTLVFRLYGWPLLAGLVGAGSGYFLISGITASALLTDLGALAAGLLAAVWVFRRLNSESLAKIIQNSISLLYAVSPGNRAAERCSIDKSSA